MKESMKDDAIVLMPEIIIPITAIEKLTIAEKWLAEAKTFSEFKQIHDVAVAAEAYASAHRLGLESENHAREIKFIAAWWIGKLVPKETAGRGKKIVRISDNLPDKQRRSEFRKLTKTPINEFKKKINALKEKQEKITYNKLLKDEKPREDKKRKFAHIKNQYDVDIRHGDFRKVLVDIPDQSVNCILTDPPYGKKYLPLWNDLAKFAARVLRKDGLLVSYSGQLYLPQILAALSSHLDWWWMSGVIHKGAGNLTPLGHPVRKVINQFKPLLIYIPKNGSGIDYVFNDLIDGTGPEKDKHNWQQPTAEAKMLLEMFCKPNDLIIDPFAGGGGFGEAARQLGMRFIGAEILNGRLKKAT